MPHNQYNNIEASFGSNIQKLQNTKVIQSI